MLHTQQLEIVQVWMSTSTGELAGPHTESPGGVNKAIMEGFQDGGCFTGIPIVVYDKPI